MHTKNVFHVKVWFPQRINQFIKTFYKTHEFKKVRVKINFRLKNLSWYHFFHKVNSNLLR